MHRDNNGTRGSLLSRQFTTDTAIRQKPTFVLLVSDRRKRNRIDSKIELCAFPLLVTFTSQRFLFLEKSFLRYPIVSAGRFRFNFRAVISRNVASRRTRSNLESKLFSLLDALPPLRPRSRKSSGDKSRQIGPISFETFGFPASSRVYLVEGATKISVESARDGNSARWKFTPWMLDEPRPFGKHWLG